MSFLEIANSRQSCRSFDPTRPVEEEKLMAIMNCARLAPSACNCQPYHFTVCRGESAKAAAKACTGLGMNKFALDAPVLIVMSEKPYNKTAAFGAKHKDIDYRSLDMGIAAAYITAEATAQGLGSCIMGWLDDRSLRKCCDLDSKIYLVIALGYAREGDKLRPKVRKDMDQLMKVLD